MDPIDQVLASETEESGGLEPQPAPTASGDASFSEPHRQQILNMLVHLAPLGGQILVVEGATGMGKTALLHSFMERVQPYWHACFIAAGQSSIGPQELLDRIQAAARTPLPAGAADADAELQEFVRGFGRRGHRLIVVVDDADRLPERSLQLLHRLMELAGTGGRELGLVVSGVDGDAIAAAMPASTAQTQRFTLAPFTLEQTKQYLKFRGADPGTTGCAAKRIYRHSGGVPGRIDAHLAGSENPSAPPPAIDSSPARPRYLKFAGVMAFGAVVATILYYQDQINALFEAGGSGPADPAVQAQLPAVSPDGAEAGSAVRSADSVTGDGATTVVIENQPELWPADASGHAVSGLPLAEHPGLSPASQVAQQEPAVAVAPATGEAAPAVTPPTSDSPRDESWLLAQPPSHYTLQLMALQDEARLLRALAPVEDKSAFAVYQVQRDDAMYHALVFGVFESYANAQSAADTLPPQLGKVKPWIRRMGALQADIRRRGGG